jgi:hypothetical protein
MKETGGRSGSSTAVVVSCRVSLGDAASLTVVVGSSISAMGKHVPELDYELPVVPRGDFSPPRTTPFIAV